MQHIPRQAVQLEKENKPSPSSQLFTLLRGLHKEPIRAQNPVTQETLCISGRFKKFIEGNTCLPHVASGFSFLVRRREPAVDLLPFLL